jgi:hypothetical protein
MTGEGVGDAYQVIVEASLLWHGANLAYFLAIFE